MSFASPTRLLALVVCALPLCHGFNIVPPRSLARPELRPRLAGEPFSMKTKEDKEFEEWVRQKKIASGVDPDEDFGAGRRAEGSIYLVGGLVTVLVPLISGIWAYNEGYLTPQ